eukprot:2164149-Lingulodinium_polyedra.AAC.1
MSAETGTSCWRGAACCTPLSPRPPRVATRTLRAEQQRWSSATLWGVQAERKCEARWLLVARWPRTR